MRRITISALLVLLILNAATTVSAHSATVQISGTNNYKAVRLSPEIYNNANKDLSDILIKNSKGEAVPYFINTGLEKVYENREVYPMSLTNAFMKDDSFYFDFKLTTGRESDTPATSIEVSTASTNFAKVIDVYGSYDDVHWDFIQNDKLYAIDGNTKLDIEFGKPQKYTHYRFKLANNLEKIAFDTANLVYSTKVSDKNYFIETLSPEFTLEEKDKTTLITLSGLKHLRLCDITIETDSMFKRTAYAPMTSSKEIYSLSFNGTSYTDTTLPLNWQIPQEEQYVIKIANNDDKPINVLGVTVRYYADEVVFEGNANESYTLHFGADAAITAPVYDIARYKDKILTGEMDNAVISTISYETEEPKPAERDYKTLFNIVVIATTVLLGGLILFRLKQK